MLGETNKSDIDYRYQYYDVNQGVKRMPLTMLPLGKEAVINECKAKETTKKFLEGLGIMPGSVISVISEMSGNLIVSVRGSRLALNKGVAQQLHVQI
jgi:ferrous iron transport protein A